MRRGRFAKTAIVIWLMAAFIAIAVKAAFEAGFRLNETPSVPLGLWRIDTIERPLRRGDIVSVCPPDTPMFRMAFERGYLSRGTCPSGLQPMLKPIAAVAGDRVSISVRGLAVNGVLLPNTAIRTSDCKGRLMPVFKSREMTVGAGQVWLVSEVNEASFDSRYVGAFNTGDIEGLARSVWVVE